MVEYFYNGCNRGSLFHDNFKILERTQSIFDSQRHCLTIVKCKNDRPKRRAFGTVVLSYLEESVAAFRLGERRYRPESAVKPDLHAPAMRTPDVWKAVRASDFGADAHELEGHALRSGHKGAVVARLVDQLAAEFVDERFRHDVGIVHADAEVVHAAGGTVGHGGVGGNFLEEDLHAGERDDGAVGSAEFAEADEFSAEGLGPERNHGVKVGAAKMDMIERSHGMPRW